MTTTIYINSCNRFPTLKTVMPVSCLRLTMTLAILSAAFGAPGQMLWNIYLWLQISMVTPKATYALIYTWLYDLSILVKSTSNW